MTVVTELLLRDRVGEELRARIADGRLPAGTRLVERDLADELEVSRVPVREALRMLQIEGFVDVQERRVAVVKALNRSDVEDLFDIREGIEATAARRAAVRCTPEDLARLDEVVARSRQALESGDDPTLHHTNSSFHEMLVEVSGNRLMKGVLAPVATRLRWLFSQNPEPRRVCHEHELIVEALRRHDPEAAATLIVEHTEAGRRMVLAVMDGSPTLDSSPSASADPLETP